MKESGGRVAREVEGEFAAAVLFREGFPARLEVELVDDEVEGSKEDKMLCAVVEQRSKFI